MKQRLKEEGNESVTNCHGLELVSKDGKRRVTEFKENLRDNINTLELALNILIEATTTELTKVHIVAKENEDKN